MVNTINMLFQPDLMLSTRARTIWDRQRMISSRISTDCGRGGGGGGHAGEGVFVQAHAVREEAGAAGKLK